MTTVQKAEKYLAEMAAHDELVNLLASTTHDPLGFVRMMFPWGEGELTEFKARERGRKTS